MADPLSMSMSIVTIIGICKASTRLLVDAYNRIHNAPKELIAMSNELVDLSVMLLQIQKTYQLDFNMQSPSAEPSNLDVDVILANELARTKELIINVNTLVSSLKKAVGGGKVETDRFGWYRKRKALDAVGNSIKSTKTNLQFLISIKMR